ncbi:MAG: histidine phosphatase family protein [Lachnospiraceae bacterium]|nr:histidine phosphatase family protein [Lachnospiraceae bacterium]
MYRRCILLRHAATPGNEEKRYTGCRTDEALSEAGRRMVLEKRTELLMRIPADAALFSSPLRRASETAEILSDDRQITPLQEMRETDFGDFEGKNYEELKEDPAYCAWIDSGGTLPFPGGESREEVTARSMAGLREALRRTPADRTACIICHGGNIMAVMSALTGGDFYDFQTGNLTGYDLELETDGERILVTAYHRLG